jgi:uncharacterized membrane protein YbaN (DUF454 family)
VLVSSLLAEVCFIVLHSPFFLSSFAALQRSLARTNLTAFVVLTWSQRNERDKEGQNERRTILK